MEKPTLSQIEANWHVHIAGIKAEKAAREKGMTESAEEALLNAASGGRIIGGVKFPPITAGFMMLMAKANRIAEKIPELAESGMDSDMGHLGSLAFILHSPELAWTIMSQKGGEELFGIAVVEFSLPFTLSDLKEIVKWIAEEMARLKQDGGPSEGKPAAE